MDSDLGVLRHAGEFRLLASKPVSAGGYLFTIHGDMTPVPSRYSVQIADGLHIDIHGQRELDELLDGYYWRFMNHSCEPNAVIRGREVFALRDLEPWDEVTFDYNTTEFEMAEPFDCRCGSRHCVGRIRGFRFLDDPARDRLRPFLAAHLLADLDAPSAAEARR